MTLLAASWMLLRPTEPDDTEVVRGTIGIEDRAAMIGHFIDPDERSLVDEASDSGSLLEVHARADDPFHEVERLLRQRGACGICRIVVGEPVGGDDGAAFEVDMRPSGSDGPPAFDRIDIVVYADYDPRDESKHAKVYVYGHVTSAEREEFSEILQRVSEAIGERLRRTPGARIRVECGWGATVGMIASLVGIARERTGKAPLLRPTRFELGKHWTPALFEHRRDRGETPISVAIDQTLAAIADRQHPDGYWTADADEPSLHTTALATLAFLGSGSSHDFGPHKGTVKKALAFLRSQSKSGRLDGDGSDGTSIETRALASLALADAYGFTTSPLYRLAADRGVSALTSVLTEALASRHPGDPFPSAVVPLTLFVALHAGLVSPEAWSDLRRHLTEATAPRASQDGVPSASHVLVRLLAAGGRAPFDADADARVLVDRASRAPDDLLERHLVGLIASQTFDGWNAWKTTIVPRLLEDAVTDADPRSEETAALALRALDLECGFRYAWR